MKNLKNTIIFYFSLLVISVLVYSCCNKNLKIIGAGDLYIVDTSNIELDTVVSEFILIMNPETKLTYNGGDLNVMAFSYATSCSFEYDNMINQESIKLSCNREFTYSNQSIEADANFANKDGIEIGVGAFKDWIEVWVRIDSVFIQNAVFEKEEYTFKLEMETDDNQVLSNSVTAFMNLN